MREIKILLGGMVIFFICSGITSAAYIANDSDKFHIANPDLTVNSIHFVPHPVEGGNIELVKVNVMNRGNANAEKCILELSCKVIKCSDGNKCDQVSDSLYAEIPVPPLRRAEAVTLEWRPASPIKWARGKYAVVANIDKYNVVPELNEANNTYVRLVYLNALPTGAPPEKK